MASISSRLIGRWPVGADLGLRGHLLGLDLGDPRADGYGVSAGVDAGAVASELAVIVRDAGLCSFGARVQLPPASQL